eukprot:SM000078S22109  [mRNA]  locus=s78:382226:382987:- [translate_table: standard]
MSKQATASSALRACRQRGRRCEGRGAATASASPAPPLQLTGVGGGGGGRRRRHQDLPALQATVRPGRQPPAGLPPPPGTLWRRDQTEVRGRRNRWHHDDERRRRGHGLLALLRESRPPRSGLRGCATRFLRRLASQVDDFWPQPSWQTSDM